MRECVHICVSHQRSTTDVISWVPSPLYFETEFLTDFEQLGCLANELGEFPVSFPTLGQQAQILMLAVNTSLAELPPGPALFLLHICSLHGRLDLYVQNHPSWPFSM